MPGNNNLKGLEKYNKLKTFEAKARLLFNTEPNLKEWSFTFDNTFEIVKKPSKGYDYGTYNVGNGQINKSCYAKDPLSCLRVNYGNKYDDLLEQYNNDNTRARSIKDLFLKISKNIMYFEKGVNNTKMDFARVNLDLKAKEFYNNFVLGIRDNNLIAEYTVIDGTKIIGENTQSIIENDKELIENVKKEIDYDNSNGDIELKADFQLLALVKIVHACNLFLYFLLRKFFYIKRDDKGLYFE